MILTIGFIALLVLLAFLRKFITKGQNPFPEHDGSYRIF